MYRYEELLHWSSNFVKYGIVDSAMGYMILAGDGLSTYLGKVLLFADTFVLQAIL